MKRTKTILRNRELVSRYIYVITRMRIGKRLTIDLIAFEFDLTRQYIKRILKEHEEIIINEFNK